MPGQDNVRQGDVNQIVATDDFIDLFNSSYGVRPHGSWRSRRPGRVVDAVFDARLALNSAYRLLRRHAARMPVRKVLVASVDVAARRADLDIVVGDLRASRHDVTVTLPPLGDRGKFQNINIGLQNFNLDDYDWLLVVDDDVALRPRFLDTFLYVAEFANLKICQPAHLFHSYTTWDVTQRVWNSLAHVTHFVECGPITAFHRDTFAHCLPFPETRWAWGIDVLWAEIARRQGFRIGVVDATPISHLREVAQSYGRQAATDEGHQLLARFNVRRDSRDLMQTIEVIRGV